MNLAAKEKIDELFPLAAIVPIVPGGVGFVFSNRSLPETRVRGSHFENAPFVGLTSWISSTSRWASGYLYDRTASDSPVGLDYADQRYYASTYGRFNTPDPYAASAHPRNPLSWNRYSYVRGDPVNHSDRRGLDCDTMLSADPSCDNESNGIGNSVSSFDLTCLTDEDNVTLDSTQMGYLGQSGGLISSDAPVYSTDVWAAPDSGASDQSSSTIWNFSYSWNLSGPGAAVGSLFGPEGAVAGWAIGSMCGIGANVSDVPSTRSWYVGLFGTCGAGIGAGGGVSISRLWVPPTQDPNSIANGVSVSTTFQPNEFLGSAVTRGSNSGPPVVGVSVGTRVPVTWSVGANICLTNCSTQP